MREWILQNLKPLVLFTCLRSNEDLACGVDGGLVADTLFTCPIAAKIPCDFFADFIEVSAARFGKEASFVAVRSMDWSTMPRRLEYVYNDLLSTDMEGDLYNVIPTVFQMLKQVKQEHRLMEMQKRIDQLETSKKAHQLELEQQKEELKQTQTSLQQTTYCVSIGFGVLIFIALILGLWFTVFRHK